MIVFGFDGGDAAADRGFEVFAIDGDAAVFEVAFTLKALSFGADFLELGSGLGGFELVDG